MIRYSNLLLFLLLMSLGTTAQINKRLLSAIKQNDHSGVEAALQAGASPNATDKLGATPLMWACFWADTAVVKTLIKRGATTTCRGVIQADTNTVYGNLTGIAAGLDKILLLQYLIETVKIPVNEPEFNPETKQNDGWPPIVWAAANGHITSLTYLLEQGADPYIQEGNPVVMALANDRKEVVTFLISRQIYLQKDNQYYLSVLPTYIEQLIDIAMRYEKQGMFSQALPLFEQIHAFYEAFINNKPDDRYVMLTSKLGQLYHLTGNHAAALSTYLKGKQAAEQALEKTNPEYIALIVNLAEFYQTVNQQSEALPLYRQGLNLLKAANRETDVAYANTLIGLGNLFVSTGQWQEATSSLQAGMTLLKKADQYEQPDYATALGSQAVLLLKTGQYEQSILLSKQCLHILEQAQQTQHPTYNTALNNLAAAYQQLGLYKEALRFTEDCLGRLSRRSGEETLTYASTLNNKATLYLQLGQYAQARDLSLEGMKILQQVVNETHPQYLTAMSNLATAYGLLNQPEKALPLLKNHEQQIARKAGKSSIEHGIALANLAWMYQVMKQPAEALTTYQESRRVWEQAQRKDHPDYIKTLEGIALAYSQLKQPVKAVTAFAEAYTANQQRFLRVVSYLSQPQQAAYLNAQNGSFIIGYSYALDHLSKQPEFAGWACNNALFHNGLLLSVSQSLYRALEQSPDTTARRLFNELKQVKANLAIQLSQPTTQRAAIDQLEQKADDIEQRLYSRSPAFRSGRQALTIEWTQVKQALKPNEAAIEYINFPYYQNGWHNSTVYAAFVIRPGYTQPKFIRLTEQRRLDTLFAGVANLPDQLNTFYRGGKVGNGKSAVTGSQGQALAQLVWQPLDSLLIGVTTVYVAAAGDLHKVAFASLSHKQQLLSQRYDIRQVNSIRRLIQPIDAPVPVLQPSFRTVLFGGIHYDADSLQLVQKTGGNPTVYVLPERQVSQSGGWKYLPGTAQELDSLRYLLPAQRTTYYDKLDATEKQVKQQSAQAPDILHLATHGFFFPEITQPTVGQISQVVLPHSQFAANENPLMRSGIVLAGANYVWKGKRTIEGIEDGLLTALEVSELHLDGTLLVVLSACETGLGQIKGSEGVYGLQRAFKIAGARYLLMSLWKIPDLETAQYMTFFYRRLLVTRSVPQAYHHAQTEMRKRYPNEPYKWAAFVLIE